MDEMAEMLHTYYIYGGLHTLYKKGEIKVEFLVLEEIAMLLPCNSYAFTLQ